MAELQRITTEYLEVEDRIRLTGEVSGGQAVVLWLTQRLLQRLLPVLLQGLAGQGADTPYGDLLHGFTQQAARSELTPEPPVEAGQGSTAWLVLSVVVTSSAEAVGLRFKGAHDQQVSLTLASKPLRQWLGIVYDAYRKAEWPLNLWPAWVQGSVDPEQGRSLLLH